MSCSENTSYFSRFFLTGPEQQERRYFFHAFILCKHEKLTFAKWKRMEKHNEIYIAEQRNYIEDKLKFRTIGFNSLSCRCNTCLD